MGLLSWIILGAPAGWLGSMITGNNAQVGAVDNIVVGILGAVIGGFIVNLLVGYGVTGFNLWSVLVSVFGSVILLTLINLVRKKA